MQRVTRDTRPAQDDPRVLEQAMAIIVRHFPASIANLYATPRTGQDGVREWWSPLEGQPQRYHDLTSEQQTTLLRVYEQRQDALRQLVGELKERGQEQEASVLRALIGPANLEHLYSVNGDPLLVRWAQPAPVKPAPVAAAPVPAPPPRRWIWLPWFLLPLLGLLLLALALWFGWPYLQRWYEQREPAKFACMKDDQALPPEFSVVLDTSGSMLLSVAATAEDEQWFFQNIADPAIDQARVAEVTRAPVRIDVAKQSLKQMVDDLHPAIDTRFITFDGCRAPLDHGLFTPAQ
ncbi:hypothetical protein, partial [Pseudomonas shirazensis]